MVDSEIHLANFLRLGFRSVEEPENADLVVVNTCGFIQTAKEQSIDTIFAMTGMKKPKVVVTGCLFQRYQDLNEQMPEVHGWLKSNTFDEVSKLVSELGFDLPQSDYYSELYERELLEKSSHAYLRISEGCNKTCSFCSIPGFKGKMVSRPIESIVAEASQLIQKGVRELNIVSQDTANYGADLYGNARGGGPLKALLKELVQLPVTRVRLLYLYPLWLNHDFYEFMASEPKICNYIDMPLQHASQRILRMMKRPGSGPEYLAELKNIRAIFQGNVALRTTMIVGFPSETEEDFSQMVELVRAADLDWMGAFPYSREESTTSYQLKNDVHHKTRQRRHKELIQAFEETREKRPSLVDSMREVIYEEQANGLWVSRSQFEAPEVDGVIYVADDNGYCGKVARVKIHAELGFDLEGSLMGEVRHA
jgi:ribosomal protein S12 methylthiotransferase